MKRRAVVDARAGRLLVASWSITEYRAAVQDDWIEVADEPVTNAVLGGLVRSGLANSKTRIPHPDFRSGPAPARRKLWKLAGVRSEGAFERGTREVHVTWDDSGPDIVITPYRNGRGRDNFTGMLDQVITVSAGADDVMLGAAVRRALDVATDGP